MDEMDDLRRMRAGLPDPTPAALAAARDRLTRRIATADPVTAPARPRRPLSWRSVLARRLAIGVAGAAAVAVGAGVVVATANHPTAPAPGAAGSHSAGTGTAVTTPGAALSLAADHTAKAGDPVVGRGRYRHVVSTSWHGEYDQGVAFQTKQRQEVWVPADSNGTWWWRETDCLDTRFASKADERKVRAKAPSWFTTKVSVASGHGDRQEAAPAGGPQPGGSGEPDWAFPTPAFLAKQPRDPKKLLAVIEAAQRPSALTKADRPTLAFLSIAQVMGSGYVPADLRASLYRAAKLIPGIKLNSTTAELGGRKGISVSKLSPYGILQQEIVFDAKTGAFIGERETVAKAIGDAAHLPVGSVYRSTSVTVDVTGNPKLF
ncbi:hypothetical protein Athai_43970 [Actinocatenispora thailandica]|uniref:CU044_5270 family protein n=1 Tax=Actinocatenispora thailandica TaxID=227318 RepID=A0A7R7DSD4_9ACTN|nr:CU044_5270 family protein [Actinocatenispora thailandica]BCJ36894.1 hypothetical protein Athai_43970 [Actinocatenispora thailandica]